jgi:HlyD family secretion protein
MPRWLLWSLPAVAVIAALLWTTVLAPERVPVKVVAVERGRVESTVTNTKAGTVRARRRAQLSPQIGGRVDEIARREGDHVKRGDVLIKLDDASQHAQRDLAREGLRAVEASRREACIQRDRARRELERKRELAKEQILSPDLLDQLESAAEAAAATCSRFGAEVGRARAQLAATEVELEKTVLRAPFDGVIAELAVEVGEWVTPSPPLLVAPSVVDVIDPSSLYISAPMDEVDSASIETGLEAVVTVDSLPDVRLPGRVVRVAPYVLDVEAQNRTVEIEVELTDAALAARLLPGTSADVEVVLEARNAALRIPTSALLEGNRVLVPEDGRLAERSLEVGLKNWNYAEVRSGLEEGDRVVISLDRAEVKAGARVEVEETVYRP